MSGAIFNLFACSYVKWLLFLNLYGVTQTLTDSRIQLLRHFPVSYPLYINRSKVTLINVMERKHREKWKKCETQEFPLNTAVCYTSYMWFVVCVWWCLQSEFPVKKNLFTSLVKRYCMKKGKTLFSWTREEDRRSTICWEQGSRLLTVSWQINTLHNIPQPRPGLTPSD